MYYIRTKKNKYDVDVIIDVTTDSTYKNHTSLEWKDADISAPGPQIGDFWYGGKSISLDSSDYSIIEKVIDDNYQFRTVIEQIILSPSFYKKEKNWFKKIAGK